MSRYSPTVTPEYYGPDNPGRDIADALGSYIGLKRQEKLDKRAEDEYAYLKGRRATTDPLEDALHRAELIRQGVLPADAAEPGASGDAGSLPQRGNRTQSDYGGSSQPLPPPQRGNRTQSGFGGDALTIPGSYDPRIGAHLPAMIDDGDGRRPTMEFNRALDRPRGGSMEFNIPRDGGDRFYDLGGGFRMIDPIRHREMQAQEDERRLVAAGIPAGVAAYAARHPEHSQAILSDFFTSRDTAYHPRTMAEALDYERQLAAIRASHKTPTERNDELKILGQQIDDTRADLGAATRAVPTRPMIFPSAADSVAFSRDSLNAAGRVNVLRSRADSLEGVRDATARGLPFDPLSPRPGETPRDYAARLKQSGKSRAEAEALFRRYRVSLQ